MEILKLTDLKSFLADETNQFKKIKERTSQMITSIHCFFFNEVNY